MRKRFHYITLLFVFLLSTNYWAQITRISGKIVDSETTEPLPFVTVAVKGTTTGATTDFDGQYTLEINSPSDSIVISYVGYIRVSKAIKKNATQVINVALQKNTFNLNEIVIKPGENPAHKILRKVIANKDKNDKEKLEAYQYEVYNKIEFDLNNISDDLKKSRALKPIRFIFDYVDSSDIKQKPFLPLFITESLSDYYYKKNPKNKKEIIKGSKISGVQDASISQFMGEMYQKVNIYDNTILVFGKNFVSPISDNGLLYYKYYLIDSMLIENTKCYQIQFKPKRKQELTFNGNIWIADTAFAVKQLEMNIVDDANINFINTFNVVQQYKQVEGSWMLQKDKLVVDFNLREKQTGFYGRKTTSYKNIVLNKPQEDSFYSRTENLIVDENAYKKDEAFWQKSRHDSLSKNERQIYKMVDTIQQLPIYKTWVDIVTIFVSGYRVMGNFEYGPYYNGLSFNRIEGPRLRVGGRTSDKFSKWYELRGYVAYGLKDEKWKYSLGFKSYISKNPRQLVGMSYKNDVEVLGQSQNAFTQDNILASIFRRNPLNNLTSVKELKSFYEREWFTGLNTKLFFINRTITPLGSFKYEYAKNDGAIGLKENIITSEVRLLTRFAYDEKYVSTTFSRTSLGTKYPVVQLEYTHGLSNFFNSHYNYQRLMLNIEDRFRINPLGYTDYSIQAGKIFGQIPYPLMELHGGNETYVYDPYAFNMMNYFEFASDRYATISIYHHFEGFFLNKIPLLRKLKWREVVTAKYLVGSAFEKNKQLLLFPTTLNSLNKGPYYEAGAGIENIFKIFRIDMLWRLSYLNNPNISKFGFRASFQVSF